MTRDLSLLFMRLFVGGIFVLSGILKLMEPTEEFIAQVTNYQFLPEVLITPFATILPFVELIFGLFLIIGLYHRISSTLLGLSLLSFIIALSWTLFQGISLADCGCFGGKIPFLEASQGELVFRDIILLLFTVTIFKFAPTRWSIDRVWAK